MEFINATRMTVGYNVGLEPTGRELLVVVIKGTFVLPKTGESVRLHQEQVPLIVADSFTGKPGLSAPVHEADFAPRKPACDVLLVGSAHAPEGRPVTRMQVGMRVGSMQKRCEVVGDRVWQAGLTGISTSSPQPFAQMPISYDQAFGGTDRHSEYASEHDAFLPNPVGRGWHKHLKNSWVDGAPLPNTEEMGKPVGSPTDKYKPMAFGPIGRGWPQRARFAGTYDDRWLADVFPFLPTDFDERYYQAAPEDQQLAEVQGPIEVVLTGFTADGVRRFVLPHFEAPVHVFPKNGALELHRAGLDTLTFEPDHGRLTMTWRLTRPLRRDIFDIAQVVIGREKERVPAVQDGSVALAALAG